MEEEPAINQQEFKLRKKEMKGLLAFLFIISFLFMAYASFKLGCIYMCQKSEGVYAADNHCYFPKYDPKVTIEGDEIRIDKGFNSVDNPNKYWINPT